MTRPRLQRAVAAGLFLALLAAVVLTVPGGNVRAADSFTRFTVNFPLYTSLGSFVYPVVYYVPHAVTPVKASMQALIAGIPGSPFIPLPKDTEVQIISIRDGICTVNFSREIQGLNVGSGGEAAVVSAIATTLAQFQGSDGKWVEKVKILIDGEAETLAGHVDLADPISTGHRPVFQVMDDAYQHWSGGAVGALMALDVINGFEDGTFRPDVKVTRAQFVKMLVEGLRLPYAASQTVPFKDVTGKWHEDYVRRALARGLLKASDYGEYLKPDEVIPREEMAALLVTGSAAYLQIHPEIDYKEVSPAPVFGDMDAAAERYRASIQESTKLGFLCGFEDGTFRPKEGLTRGEAATVIARALGMAETSDPNFKHIIRMSPLQGAKWDGGSLNALGAASAFEANVNWRVKNATGEIMKNYTTASMGMGWGLFGLHVDAALFADKSPTELEFFLVSMKDGSEFSGVPLPLAR